MWYDFKKLNETDDTIEYAFGYEKRELTDRFVYDKKTKKAEITQGLEKTEYFSFDTTVYTLIEEYGAPDEKMIAYG